MDGSGRDKDKVPLRDGNGAETALERIIPNSRFQLAAVVILLQSVNNLCIGHRIEHIPTFGFTGAVLVEARIVIIRMHLHRKRFVRLNDFNQKRIRSAGDSVKRCSAYLRRCIIYKRLPRRMNGNNPPLISPDLFGNKRLCFKHRYILLHIIPLNCILYVETSKKLSEFLQMTPSQ